MDKKEKKKYPSGYFILWGMLVFGIPMGIAMSLALDNMAFIGTGIGIGLPIGVAIEQNLKKEGRIIPASDEVKNKRKWILYALVGLTVLAVILTLLFVL